MRVFQGGASALDFFDDGVCFTNLDTISIFQEIFNASLQRNGIPRLTDYFLAARPAGDRCFNSTAICGWSLSSLDGCTESGYLPQ